jgi:hypothetical protein
MSEWIPEAQFQAAMFAIRDVHFPGPPGREGFRRWTHELAASLFRTPLYRALFFVVSPTRLLRGMEARWHTFHRGGVELRLLEEDKNVIRLRLSFPAFLYSDLSVIGISTSCLAAAEAAGAHDATVKSARASESEAEIVMTWR